MPTTAKIRLLIADDHAVLRDGMCQLLSQYPDLEVVGAAANGMEALRLTEDLSPDVVLMDIVMPELDGIEATRRIKAVRPATAILPLTAYDDERYVVGLLQAGAAGYILKSATTGEIVEAIRTVYAGESVLHPAATVRLLSRALHSPAQLSRNQGSATLTERELDILKLAAQGIRNRDIAASLSLSLPTVKAHLTNIFNKMGVASRTEAALEALRRGWIQLQESPSES